MQVFNNIMVSYLQSLISKYDSMERSKLDRTLDFHLMKCRLCPLIGHCFVVVVVLEFFTC